jgi:hypothetical protein
MAAIIVDGLEPTGPGRIEPSTIRRARRQTRLRRGVRSRLPPGTLELRRADLVAQAKEELQHEYNAQAASARAKLHQLLEHRTHTN